MNLNHHELPAPNQQGIPSEPVFKDLWNSKAVTELIRSKSGPGETPAFLFLGRRETELLKTHLAECFGKDSVPTLNNTYYKGLKVVTIERDSFLNTGGRKSLRILQDPISHRPSWRVRETAARWQFQN